jgi:hypothetical protein
LNSDVNLIGDAQGSASLASRLAAVDFDHRTVFRLKDGQNDTLPFEQPEDAVGLTPGWNRNDPLRHSSAAKTYYE